jgi:hypothetical protein
MIQLSLFKCPYRTMFLTRITKYKITVPSSRYPYFDVVVGLAWSYDPESYAGGSVAAGRISHARQVKGDDPDKKGYPGLQVGVWAWG